MIGTVSWIEFVWVTIMSYGIYRALRSVDYTYKTRLFWSTDEAQSLLNGRTDLYTFDRFRTSLLLLGAVFCLWLAGVTAMTFPPNTQSVDPEYLRSLPALALVIGGIQIIILVHYSELAQRALLGYKAEDAGIDTLPEANENE